MPIALLPPPPGPLRVPRCLPCEADRTLIPRRFTTSSPCPARQLQPWLCVAVHPSPCAAAAAATTASWSLLKCLPHCRTRRLNQTPPRRCPPTLPSPRNRQPVCVSTAVGVTWELLCALSVLATHVLLRSTAGEQSATPPMPSMVSARHAKGGRGTRTHRRMPPMPPKPRQNCDNKWDKSETSADQPATVDTWRLASMIAPTRLGE